MGLYNPQPTVEIGGISYTSLTIAQIQITAGRSTVDEQPRAGFCTIRLLNATGLTPVVQLNDTTHINIVTSAGSDPRIFSGYVTDIQRTVRQAGPNGLVTETVVTAVGPLARLARFGTAATYPKQYDGDRIAAILQDAYTTSWDEVASAITWNSVDPALTWLNYDPGYVGTIDTPGDYEMYAYSGGIVSAASLCADVAKSGLGVLYETPEGYINYDSSTARIDRAALTGFTEIDAGYIAAIGLESNSSIATMVNDLTVTYKNGAQVSGDDSDSIGIYGRFAAVLTTYLESGTAAQQQLDHYLATRSLARINLGAVTIALHNSDLPDSIRDTLIGAYCGLPIFIPNLPIQLVPTGFTGFVEGYRWEITNKTATLTMNVSDYGLTAITQAWLQVNPAEAWNTISATLEWQDARIVA